MRLLKYVGRGEGCLPYEVSTDESETKQGEQSSAVSCEEWVSLNLMTGVSSMAIIRDAWTNAPDNA